MLALAVLVLLPSAGFGQVEGPDYWWVQDNNGTTPGKTFRGICALDEENVWVVGEGGYVYHRSGQVHDPTWTRITNLPAGYNYYDFNDVCFVDADHGWIVGEKRQTGDATDYSGVIFYTANGGTSWTDQTTNIWPTFPIPTPFRKVKMVWKQLTQHYVGYIACGNGAILKTEDDGLTWSRSQTDPWSDPANVSNWYNGLWVNPSPGYDQQVWVAGDAFSLLAKTENGGQTCDQWVDQWGRISTFYIVTIKTIGCII
jgi:photosystem II stability/assembly factor-like uncharacterized protein